MPRSISPPPPPVPADAGKIDFEYITGYIATPEKPPQPYEEETIRRVVHYLNDFLQSPMNGFPDPQNYRRRDATAGQKAPRAFDQETVQRVVYFLNDFMRSPVNGFPDPQNYRHRDDLARQNILVELAALNAKLM